MIFVSRKVREVRKGETSSHVSRLTPSPQSFLDRIYRINRIVSRRDTESFLAAKDAKHAKELVTQGAKRGGRASPRAAERVSCLLFRHSRHEREKANSPAVVTETPRAQPPPETAARPPAQPR